MLLAAWKKALRGDELRTVLERRAAALKASEDDVSVWLAWQETYGTCRRHRRGRAFGRGQVSAFCDVALASG
jgi:hypothetical protein